MKMIVNGYVFTTKKALLKYVADILHSTPLHSSVSHNDFLFLSDLFLTYHPDGQSLKNRGGIVAIEVRPHVLYRTPGFWICTADDEWRNISYRNAVTQKKLDHKTKVLRACRYTILEDILAYKMAWFDRYGDNECCPIFPDEKLTWNNAQIDHVGFKFRDIVTEFLLLYDLDFNDIGIHEILGGDSIDFTDRVLKRTFYEFHAERASYRVISAKANVYVEHHQEATQ